MFVKVYPKEVRERFLNLYEQGLTYGKIAKEIGISKSCVIRWANEVYNLEPNYSPDLVGHRYLVKYIDQSAKKEIRMFGFAKNKEVAKKTVLHQLMQSRNMPKENFVFVSCERRDKGDIKRNGTCKV